ncbi:MAG: hypothetical protein H7X97_14285 [Opitutaceae bacterium]|nr:hypothetical protein [Verrucomicrobiales bacterium]
MGQARFERRPTDVVLIDGVVLLVVGRRGETPLVPPYLKNSPAVFVSPPLVEMLT